VISTMSSGVAQVDGRSLLRRQPLHAASPSFAPDCFCATAPLISVSSCDGLDMRPPDSAVRGRARRGDRDDAIPLMFAAVDHLFREGQILGWGTPATGVLVETLLDRGAESDVAEAEAAIERLAAAPADDGLVIRDIWLLRLRALLAQAGEDEAAYRGYRDRYRDMATSLGFEGHMEWAEAMP
jgi:hypothetical protein